MSKKLYTLVLTLIAIVAVIPVIYAETSSNWEKAPDFRSSEVVWLLAPNQTEPKIGEVVWAVPAEKNTTTPDADDPVQPLETITPTQSPIIEEDNTLLIAALIITLSFIPLLLASLLRRRSKATVSLAFIAFLACSMVFTAYNVPAASADQMATSGYKLANPTGMSDYQLHNYTDGSFGVNRMSDWANLVTFIGYVGGNPAAGLITPTLAGYSTNASAIWENIFDVISYGVIESKEVAVGYTTGLSTWQSAIPDDVQVDVSYQGNMYRFANPLNTAGSPYTVAVGSKMLDGTYTAEDSKGRILWSSTNYGQLVNNLLPIVNATTGTIKMQSGSTFTITTMINDTLYFNVNLDFEGAIVQGAIPTFLYVAGIGMDGWNGTGWTSIHGNGFPNMNKVLINYPTFKYTGPQNVNTSLLFLDKITTERVSTGMVVIEHPTFITTPTVWGIPPTNPYFAALKVSECASVVVNYLSCSYFGTPILCSNNEGNKWIASGNIFNAPTVSYCVNGIFYDKVAAYADVIDTPTVMLYTNRGINIASNYTHDIIIRNPIISEAFAGNTDGIYAESTSITIDGGKIEYGNKGIYLNCPYRYGTASIKGVWFVNLSSAITTSVSTAVNGLNFADVTSNFNTIGYDWYIYGQYLNSNYTNVAPLNTVTIIPQMLSAQGVKNGTAVFNNTGSSVIAYTGSTQNSVTDYYTALYNFNNGDGASNALDFSRRLEIVISGLSKMDSTNANAIARIQIGSEISGDELSSTGIGITISGLSLNGTAYGSSLGTVSLKTITSNSPISVKIVFIPNQEIDFYIWHDRNWELYGTLSGASLPSGWLVGAKCSVSVSNYGVADSSSIILNSITINQWSNQWGAVYTNV